MEYYGEKQKANMRISKILENAKLSGKEIDINKIILDVTNDFKIGEGAVKKRILLIQSVDKDFDIIDGTIVFRS